MEQRFRVKSPFLTVRLLPFLVLAVVEMGRLIESPGFSSGGVVPVFLLLFVGGSYLFRSRRSPAYADLRPDDVQFPGGMYGRKTIPYVRIEHVLPVGQDAVQIRSLGRNPGSAAESTIRPDERDAFVTALEARVRAAKEQAAADPH